jgi:hypothetical protein
VRTTTTKLLALGTAAALGLAACGGSDEETVPAVSGEARPVQETEPAAGEQTDATTEEAEAPAVETSTDDAASTLRAELTALLQEHVHLTAFAVDAVVDEGADAAGAQSAVQALDESSTALGERIAGIPSVEDPEAFLEPWQTHVDAYLDLARAQVDEDDDAAVEATAALEEAPQPLADFFEEISDGELGADELFGELETHVAMVTDAIDAHAGGDTEAVDLWRDAALQMDALAADVAEGIVAAHPDELAGDPLSVAAETRATLTSALVEHTYLTLFAAGEAADAGGATDDPAVQAAVTTLDSSADDLANAASGVQGMDGRDAFLDAWRPFLTAATDFAAATASGDAAAAEEARSTMDAAPGQLATVFQEATAGNTAGDLTDVLTTHVTNLTAAIEATVADDPAAATQARTAAQHATTVAAGLAAAFDTAASEAPTGDGSAAGSDTAATESEGAGGTDTAGTSGTGGEG